MNGDLIVDMGEGIIIKIKQTKRSEDIIQTLKQGDICRTMISRRLVWLDKEKDY